MYIKRVEIKNFRTLGTRDKETFEIELDRKFQIIAGANNSGKSNLLRALNIFFNEGFDEDSYYDKTKDLSYHIEKGTGSSVAPTTIEVDLFLEEEEIKKIKDLDKFIYSNNIIRTRSYYFGELEGWYHSNEDGSFPIKSDLKKGNNLINKKSHTIQKLFNRIQFMFIPAQYDIGNKINQLVAEEILPSMVDSYGNTGLSSKIKKLKNKIDEVDKLTKEVLKEKNELISQSFRDVIKLFPEVQAGIDLEKYALEVDITGESLSDILSKRISLNVQDASHKEVDSKGSGIQKLVLITLLEYFSKNIEAKARYTNPFLIWAIDEPETYMQPKLQKQISKIFKDISETHQVICTTHSPKMIDIFNPQNVKLFFLETEAFSVTRKGGKIMFKKITGVLDNKSIGFIDKLKEHFGVESNDGWILRDKNLLFEGSDDVIYFHTTFELIMKQKLDVANVVSSSSEYMPNFIELLYQQISNKELKSNSLICLLDNDESGIKAFNKINKFKTDNSKSKKYIKSFKTISMYLDEKDNKNDNYPSMIEDMIIPEYFYKSIVSFLIEKYTEKKEDIHNNYSCEEFIKFRKQSKRVPILEVVDNYFDDIINESKNFSFTGLDIKYGLANKYKRFIEELEDDEKEKIRINYSSLNIFFKGFL